MPSAAPPRASRTRRSRAALTWRQADHDVFVADLLGEFAGHITVDADVHTVYDRVGRRRGAATTLEHARELLEAEPAREAGHADRVAAAELQRAHASRRRRRMAGRARTS